MLALLKAFAVLAPIVKDLVVTLVRAIADSPDPEKAARRALEEAARVKALDKILSERGRRK